MIIYIFSTIIFVILFVLLCLLVLNTKNDTELEFSDIKKSLSNIEKIQLISQSAPNISKTKQSIEKIEKDLNNIKDSVGIIYKNEAGLIITKPTKIIDSSMG